MTHKARIITTAEGRYISVEDIKAALRDDVFVDQCAAMLAVGHQSGASVTEMVRRTIGCAIMILVGDEDKCVRRYMKKSRHG